ncbi:MULTISPECIES: hypothetical protein [Bacillus]|uniref:hypothetical protein n=1 Tax=Bacillus TaxID=1386 RepID=UPI001ABE1A87|nr:MULTISPECIES: hypothetical protein [Bacillus]MBR7817954.1 hypothetical protein [Bacillus sp. CCNWLCWHY013]MDJ0479986.1 hypothetical protein [Bacillus amyloliquefaciens]QTG87430.1 hypothetical protein J4048_22005 [Bacillus amyloliquefaciens]
MFDGPATPIVCCVCFIALAGLMIYDTISAEHQAKEDSRSRYELVADKLDKPESEIVVKEDSGNVYNVTADKKKYSIEFDSSFSRIKHMVETD